MADKLLTIFMIFGLITLNSSVKESRMNVNDLRQLEDRKFEHLLRNVFPPSENHQLKEGKNLGVDFLSQLVALNKNHLKNLTDKYWDTDTPVLDHLAGTLKEPGEHSQQSQKTRESDASLDDSQNLDKSKTKDDLSLLQKNEVLADLFSLLAPYLEGKATSGEENWEKLLSAPKNRDSEVKHAALSDVKASKNHAETDKWTGTKFFDSRPNMTDLLSNIRNITKSRHNETKVGGLATESLMDPLIALGEQDLYYGPTATYGLKETYASKERLAGKQKASEVKRRAKFDELDLRETDLRDETSLIKTGRKINRSVKIEKRTFVGEPASSSGTVSKVSSPKNASNPSPLARVENSKSWMPEDRFTRRENHFGLGPSGDSPDFKKLNLKTDEIAALTARIVADIVKEIDKRYRHEKSMCDESSKGQTEELDVSPKEPSGNCSKKVEWPCQKLPTEAPRKDEVGILKNLNLPVVTTKLMTKAAGIPLYKIPNTEIYIFELCPARVQPRGRVRITDQSDLATILDQLIANSSLDYDQKRRLSHPSLSLDPSEDLGHQSTFDKNLLPDFFDSLLQSKPEDGAEKALKFSDYLKTPSTNQGIPEIEIHIKTMPLNTRNKTDPDAFHKKPAVNRRDPFSDLFLFNGRSPKNFNPTAKIPDQHKMTSGGQQQVKKKLATKQQSKVESDSPEMQRGVRNFWGLKSK